MVDRREPQRREFAPKKWEPLANHPVDVSLYTLQGAIEYAVGQPVTLGLYNGKDHGFERDVTGAIQGNPSFLAYGAEGTEDLWEFTFWNRQLEKKSYENWIEHRSEYTGVDTREFSRIMVADAEVKPLGKFTKDAIIQVINIPAAEIASSDIDLGNVSHSQARRIIDVMRNQYASGNWRETLQLALAVPHINRFIEMARQKTNTDLDGTVVTIADKHIGQELAAEYRTDVDLLVARALKKGVQELRSDGRKEAAKHTEAWLSMHEEKLTLDSFPPEVTLDDMLKYPSYLNPRPDKGVPVISSTAYLTAGTTSRNYTIQYPDGSVYAVDYPIHGREARPIKGKEEEGYRGNVHEGTVYGFVNVRDNWLDFPSIVRGHVATKLVEEAMRKDTSLKKDTRTYAEILRAASTFVDEQDVQLDDKEVVEVKTRLAAVLMAVQCVRETESTVGSASTLYEYSARGFGNKQEVEDETGISLSLRLHTDLPKKEQEAYRDFGDALSGYELARLAEAYADHPEFSEHIAVERTRQNVTESDKYYYEQMMEAVQRLIGKGKTSKLAEKYYRTAQIGNTY